MEVLSPHDRWLAELPDRNATLSSLCHPQGFAKTFSLLLLQWGYMHVLQDWRMTLRQPVHALKVSTTMNSVAQTAAPFSVIMVAIVRVIVFACLLIMNHIAIMTLAMFNIMLNTLTTPTMGTTSAKNTRSHELTAMN